jgi:hypothetical protein
MTPMGFARDLFPSDSVNVMELPGVVGLSTARNRAVRLSSFFAASSLDRQNCFWGSLAEPLDVELFDKLRQGQLPRLLLVVIDLANSPGSSPSRAMWTWAWDKWWRFRASIHACMFWFGFFVFLAMPSSFLSTILPTSPASDIVEQEALVVSGIIAWAIVQNGG